MRRRTFGFLPLWWRDRSGGVLIYTALMAPVLVGFAGLSIDVGLWYAQARSTQAAVDSAAIAGALEILRSNSDSAKVSAAVDSDLSYSGYSAADGATVEVHFPPVSGSKTGAGDSVEVIVSRAAPGFFSAVLFAGGTTVAARAVAMADVNDTCIWSLNPSESSAVKVSGGAQVDLGCGIIANSADPSGLTQSGSGCLNSTKIKVVGGYAADCISPQPLAGASPVMDPLASLQPPPYDPNHCDVPGNVNVNSGQNVTLLPGRYCGRIKVNSAGTAHFQPGVYILEDGLSISSSSNVTGTDVSFYLPPTAGSSDNISIAAGATVTLSAPAGGPLPGVLFYHDRNAPTNVTHNFSGGSTMNLEGILYFPSTDVTFSGGSSLNSSTSLIIADTVTFTGNTTIGGFENSPILANPLLITATLVE